MGLSGSGKTTLLKSLLNLNSYQGEIYWKRKCVKNFKKKEWQEFRKSVAPVFQDPASKKSLSPRISVKQILLKRLKSIYFIFPKRKRAKNFTADG